ncbi:MAG: nucleoside triphosphate pyrophosphatase [Velocimicrobium sp.]
MKIILASGSPRRREILDQIGILYEVKPSNKEEVIKSTNPAEVVEELSHMKANDIAKGEQEPCVVIGADTVVSSENKILGKPKDEEDAVCMIQNLCDRAHSVFTGVTIIKKENGRQQIQSFCVETNVYVAKMTDEEIRAYVATKEPMDKAGAYAIQGKFAPYIERIEGDYYNVVGFPISSICRALKEMDVKY